MRQRPLRVVSIVLASLAAAGFVACAQGTGDGVGSHPDAHVAPGTPDANLNQPADAPPFSAPDAFVAPADAFVAPTPDGANAIVCNTTAECGTGSCCVDVLGLGGPPGACLPDIGEPCLP